MRATSMAGCWARDVAIRVGGARRGTAGLAVAILLGAAPCAGAFAQAMDWRALTSRPSAFEGRTMRLSPAFCGTGGQDGKDPGLYQCAVGPGAIYAESRTVTMSRAARARIRGCGGLDVWERSETCRFTVAFVVGRHRPAPDIDAKSRPLLFMADGLTIE